MSGAQKVTAFQIKTLKAYYDVSLFSLVKPDAFCCQLFGDIHYCYPADNSLLCCFGVKFKDVLVSFDFKIYQKIIRILGAIFFRLGLEAWVMRQVMNRELKKEWEAFDCICVVSEASKFKSIVASLKNPQKIQWIHIDYAYWSKLNQWTQRITKHDKMIFQHFDKIILLANSIKENFLKIYPTLSNKVDVISNPIDVTEILMKSQASTQVVVDSSLVNIVTIGRLDTQKALFRTISIAKQLALAGYKFCWYLVGSGPLQQQILQCIEVENLTSYFVCTGLLQNPYPLLSKCTLFALLSDYEGLPITIYEALILHVPVFATAVGAVASQIENNVTGWLVENKEEDIFFTLNDLLGNPEKILTVKNNLAAYFFDNNKIKNQLKKLFEVNDL